VSVDTLVEVARSTSGETAVDGGSPIAERSEETKLVPVDPGPSEEEDSMSPLDRFLLRVKTRGASGCWTTLPIRPKVPHAILHEVVDEDGVAHRGYWVRIRDLTETDAENVEWFSAAAESFSKGFLWLTHAGVDFG
jgi:hypothetical protein